MTTARAGVFSDFGPNWKSDIVSGFTIFLIALPLSIGIATASGAPPTAGILAAILGGVIGTLFTGTHVAINGPAAGLIVVVLHSVTTLGAGDNLLGFKRTLAITLAAGLIQIALGLLRTGNLALKCPTAVVHGMLTAIGVIIIIKQAPVLLGVTPERKGLLQIVADMPQHIQNADLPIFGIGLTSLLLLILWNWAPKKLARFIPGPLMSVALGMVFGVAFALSTQHDVVLLNHHYTVGPSFLVKVPPHFGEMFVLPDFSVFFTLDSLFAMVSILIVASLESVLSARAVDQLDPLKRTSDLNRELIGKGMVNSLCGLLGALPIISEIVRSSANIQNGAQSRWSNFFHGIFIFIFVAMFPSVLSLIPLAALAGVLIFVGFRLAHPRQFIEVWKHSRVEFLVFMTTLTLTVVEDLLVGIAAGIVLTMFIHGLKMLHARFVIIGSASRVTLGAAQIAPKTRAAPTSQSWPR